MEHTTPNTEDFTLDELSGEDFSLSDLSTSPLYNIKVGDKSNNQLATTTALLTGDEETAALAFQEVSQEMAVEGATDKQKAIVAAAREANLADIQDSLVNVLLDESVSSEGKKAASQFALDETSKLFNVRRQLMTKQLASPLHNENKEVERVRGNFSEQIDQVNDVLDDKQKLLNQRVAAVDVNTSGMVVEFFEAMLPFGRQKLIGGIVSDLKEQLGEGFESSRVKSFLALGESFEDVQELIKSVPVAERGKVTQMLADIIDQNAEIVIPDENGYAKVDLLRTFLEEGYYEDGSKWVDNIIGLLDITIIGGPVARMLKGGSKAASGAKTIDDIVRDFKPRDIVSEASEISAGRNLELSNPDSARAAFDGASTSDEVATAFYGTNAADVTASRLNPRPVTQDIVEATPSQMGRDADVRNSGDPDMLEFANRDGKIYYTETQKRQMRSQVYNDFERVNGLTLRENITQVGRDDSDGIVIKAMYAPNADAGWESLEDAVTQTMFGLRKYGITERDVEVLDTAQGYVVAVNFKYDYNPLDVTDFDKTTVNLNVFDKAVGTNVKLGQGINLTRMLKDPSSLFDPIISKGALRAEDRSAAIEKRLIESSRGFDEAYLKLSKEGQFKMHEYIKEANQRSLPMTNADLTARGFNATEVAALNEWKGYWDTMYLLENSDMTKKLNSQGWEMWSKGNSTLITRKVAQNRASGIRKVYDGVEDSIVSLSDEARSAVYAGEGYIAELRTAIKVGEDEVTHMVIPQNSTSFSRRLREEDRVLNYRDGYYTVKYEAPYFVDKEILDEAGNVVRVETVATAGTQKEAKSFIDRANRTEAGNANYITRNNRTNDRTMEDDYIDVAISQGRTPQRFRGERLRDASGTTDMNEKYIKDPIESMIDAARNISNRTSYRDYLETTKKRFVDNYKDVLVKQHGRYTFPSNIGGIVKNDLADGKDFLSARQTWEYINYLENGYINGIDEGFQTVMRSAAEIVGSKSALAESAFLAAGNLRPMGLGKNVAFQSYLALNPLRQFIVQGHQAIQLAALEPVFYAKSLLRQTAAMLSYRIGRPNEAAKMFGVTRPEMDAIVKSFDDSGLVANVDRHAMIQGSLTQMADSWAATSKAKRTASNVVGVPRKMGFDAGENLNMTTAWLTMRHRAIKAGKDVSRTDVQAEVGALARDFTYSMNFSGDMPYNQNYLAGIMQFMQAPHKSVLQMTSNRNLTGLERSRLAVYNMAMYSLPPTLMYGVFPSLAEVENETIRDTIVFGVETTVLNTLISGITGAETRLDFSSLAPADMYGFYDIITTLWTDGIGEAVMATPASSLLFGHNPRITNAFKGAGRFFGWYDDDVESPEDLYGVVKGFASISSGYSNYMKWNYANKTTNKISSSGKLTEVTGGEAIGALFGLGTIKETQQYISNKTSYEKGQEFKDDFNKWYGDYKVTLASKGIANSDAEFSSRIMRSAMIHFGDHKPAFTKMLFQKLGMDLQDGDFRMYSAAKRAAGIMDVTEFKEFIVSAPLDEELRKQLIEQVEMTQKHNEEE